MKILILATEDDANWGHALTRIFSAHEVTGLKLVRHAFGYPNQLKITDIKEMQQACLTTDLVIFPQMDLEIYRQCYKYFDGKKVGVCHGGSLFRQNKRFCNDILNRRACFQWILEYDLWDAGTRNKFFTGIAVDTDFIRPDYNYYGLTIRHSPSSDTRKGTPAIVGVLNELKSKYPRININVSTERLIWEQNLQRVNACDIYVDELTLYQGEEVMGCYGMSSVEAAAMGKIVVSNNLWEDQYRKEYGVNPMVMAANSREEMYSVLEGLILKSREDILELKKQSRKWAETYHSYPATYERAMWQIEQFLTEIIEDDNFNNE